MQQVKKRTDITAINCYKSGKNLLLNVRQSRDRKINFRLNDPTMVTKRTV